MSTEPQRVQIYEHDHYERLCEALAEKILSLSEKAIKKNDRFVIALAGGSTPKGLYRRMSEAPFHDQFNWQKTHFFWGDERWTPIDDISNNYRMVAEALLARIDIPPENIHPIVTTKENPETMAVHYEEELRSFFRLKRSDLPMFDLVLLGVGQDGHTASLFSGTLAIEERERLVVATSHEDVEEPRVTLTLPAINHAENIIFVVTGTEKAYIVREILQPMEDRPVLPAQMIWPDHGTLSWYLDQAAASYLARVQEKPDNKKT